MTLAEFHNIRHSRCRIYSRTVQLSELLTHRSLFLFGPRQTGKSTLLRHTFPAARYVDLLEANTFRELSFVPPPAPTSCSDLRAAFAAGSPRVALRPDAVAA
jgi:hypothetical protein